MFDYKDLTIVVVGQGIAGSYIAFMLAKDRYRITLFQDPSTGVTAYPAVILPKTYLSFLLFKVFENRYDAVEIQDIQLISEKGRESTISLEDPLLVLSREKLTSDLTNMAEKSGARVYPHRISTLSDDDGYVLEGGGRRFGADFLIGADGMQSLIRSKVLGSSKFPLERESHALVHTYLRGVEEDKMVIRFLPNLPGYLWFMPVSQGVWAGIREFVPQKRVDLLENILHKHCTYYYGKKFGGYAPQTSEIPVPRKEDFQFRMYMGPNWALVGGAAGLLDPLTGMGTSEAIKSAYYFCDSFSKIRPSQYPGHIKTELYSSLMDSLEILPHLKTARFTNFMVSSFRKSPTFKKILTGVFSGDLLYNEARETFNKSFWKIMRENLWYNLGWK